MLTHVTRNEEQWDAFVLAHGGGFLQSWGWSHFQEALGRGVYRFRIDMPGRAAGDTGHGDTVAQFLLVYHPLPLGRKYAYIPRGPVVNTTRGPGVAKGYLETCVEALREKMRQDGSVFARVEWPQEASSAPLGAKDLSRWGFRHAKPVQPSDTSIVDLRQSEDAMLAGMHHKTRYNIRLAERHGVTVREARPENAHLWRHDLDVFWAMLGETAERDKFHTHDKRYYATMLDVLSPRKAIEGAMRVRLLFAEHKGQAAAAGLFAEFGDTCTYLHGASVASLRNLMAPYVLHWEAMRAAKGRALGAYDFWGIAPDDDSEHPWAGITRFKRGFGGRRVGYLGAWELPGDAFWYTLYRYAKRFRNL